MTRLFGMLAAAGLALTLTACGNSDADTDTTTPAAAAGDSAAGATDAPVASGNSLATTDMTMGNVSAPVKLVEYASLTCPHCATFHATMFPRLKEEYIDTGKVHFTFREFPLQRLDYLVFALSRCAADENGGPGYFAMLSTLFRNQNIWMGANRDAEILKYAAQAGITENEFRTCVVRPEITQKIKSNQEAGQAAGVNSTPSFVLNGEKMDGYRSQDEYFAMVDEAIIEAGGTPPGADDADTGIENGGEGDD